MPGPVRPPSSKEQKVQPPRPPNAWILYRSHHSALLRQNQGSERIAQSVISQMVSLMWRQETEDVRRQFEKLAEEEKLKHQRRYPDYRFCPQKKEDKLRAKKARAKKAKARDATPSDASTSASVTPAIPPVPALSSPFFWPNSMTISQQYVLPEVHFGPCGPSPPLSAAPSPVPHETSYSPQPSSDELVASSSSSSLVGPSSSSESLLALLQPSHPLNPPPALVPSSEYTVAPQMTVWNNDSKEVPMPAPLNLEVVNLAVPVVQTQNYPRFEQSASGSSQLDSMLSTDDNGVFNTSTIDSSNIMIHPLGELQVAMGGHTPTVDHHGQLFVDRDYLEFERQMASFTQVDLTSPEAVNLSPCNELESLFHHPNSADVEAYTAPQQRQSSASFPQDLMTTWLNLEDTEGSTQDLTTVAPQQIYFDNTQQVAAMAIFAQMTNVPALPASPALPYVPPAGAVDASTRRVGGSWKPPFYIPGQTEDFYSWTFATN